MTEAATKKRIFQIAKELNISHKDIIEYLNDEGIEGISLNAPIEFEIYEKILNEFSKEKQQIERFRKEQARKVVVDTRRNVDIQRESKKGLTKPKPAATSGEKKTVDPLHKLKIKITEEQQRLETTKTVKKETEPVTPDKEETAQPPETDEKKSAPPAAEKPPEPKESEKIKKEPLATLRIISRPDKAEKEALEREKLKASRPRKTSAEKSKPAEEGPKPQRKLKKIDVSTIADKINKTKRGKSREEKDAEKSRKSALHPPLPQFGKKSGRKKSKKSSKAPESPTVSTETKSVIKVPEFTTVDDLARTMDVPVNDVIKVCLNDGMMVTINQRLDMETIVLIADEFGFTVDTETEIGEDIIQTEEAEEDLKNATKRPPVVTIMGHVDHGKTSLLDYIRNENVVAGESGGITQHIGAYSVVLENGEKITFLDTPGHAAFTAMRARGANITDIVVVIIAADDGVMPQTIEALDHAKAAGVPIIIAINKVDKPAADAEKIKRELSDQNILVEDWGGKYQCTELSAKTGKGVGDLLETILLEAEVLDLKANKDTIGRATVIESRLDRGLGPVATVLVQRGTLRKGDIFICGSQYSRIRAILDERNTRIGKAYPADPVQLLGFTEVPKAGDILAVMEDEREARKISLQRSQLEREAEQRRFRHLTLEQIGKQIAEGEIQNLDIIIKGDVDGSIEALSDSLMGLSGAEVAVNIIHRSVGMITETDVSLASASRAIIIAFHVTASPEAKAQARLENVEIRHYSVIYEAVNDVKLALEGMLRPEEVEESIGLAEVRAVFKMRRKDTIAGSYIRSGKAIRNARLRIKRDGETIHEGKLTTLKRFKDDVAEVAEGYECGISVEGFNDFHEGDFIEFFEIKEVKRVLS
ncbi:MAG: translation initiation factor IF-2 [FCB group bacterium]|nr:translation initiation factor IF-2 [FCB group bacterium]